MSALPERTGSLVTHRNLKGVEQHLARRLWQVFGPETFQVELDGFFEVGLSILDGLSLAHGTQFHTPGDVPGIFFRDDRRKPLHDRGPSSVRAKSQIYHTVRAGGMDGAPDGRG